MAFDLELVRTKLTDFVHTLETDLGPTVEKVKEALSTVLGQVHAQVVADESTLKEQAIGDVKVVEDTAFGTASSTGTAAEKPAASEASKTAEKTDSATEAKAK